MATHSLSYAKIPQQMPPPSLRARMLRSMRFMRRARGWGRLIETVLPENVDGTFLARNPAGFFAGNLRSFIDRQNYLLGGYEREFIDTFLSLIPRERRNVAVDVGANCGIHSFSFARAFRRVHSFEPNWRIVPALRANIHLNHIEYVTVHEVGLSDRSVTLPFYAGDKPNSGMGTFSTSEQYDFELSETDQLRVEPADEYLAPMIDLPIDAIKIDVQGFEPQVLRGARGLLEKHRPYVWLEANPAMLHQISDASSLRAFFPYPVKLLRISFDGAIWRRVALTEVVDGPLPGGDYFVCPA